MQLAHPLRSKRQVPMQKEQRREALLPIQGAERSVLHVAVDEVETHALASGDGAMQDFEEVRSDALDDTAFAPLRVVSLDERDLDALNGRRVRRAAREQGVVG